LEANFSCFAKIIWMPSWFAKMLELLLYGWVGPYARVVSSYACVRIKSH
jgi:hypothetical protein